jgi:hypothetical protein
MSRGIEREMDFGGIEAIKCKKKNFFSGDLKDFF